MLRLGPHEGMKRKRPCIYRGELDLPTLAWTRGRELPIGMLASRLKSPRCGSRKVRIAFTALLQSQQARTG